MKVSITILTVVAFATMTSAASNEFERRLSGLQNKLHSAWEKASNGKVGTLISQAIKTLKTASLAGPEAGAAAVDKVEAMVPSLESLNNGGPATRSSVVSSLAGLVGERQELLGTLLTATAENMQKQGNGPWATILNVAGEWVRNNLLKDENMKNLANKGADALDVIEDALLLFNNFSGGMRPVLNMITNAVETLDSASDILLKREKDDDTRNIVVSKLISMLYNVKNAQNQAAFDAINKVCEKMHTSQAQQS